VRLRLDRRIAKVAEDREMNVRIEVADRLDLQVLGEIHRALDAVEDRRDDDHGFVRHFGISSYSIRGSRRGWHEITDQTLQNLDR
jgi:hypothetical protein